MALSPTFSLTVRSIILTSSRNYYCVLSNKCLGLGSLQHKNLNLPFKIQKAQKYSDKKREPKLGDLSYFRYQIRHDDKDERLARSRSWEYKLSKYLFALPGFITLAIIFGVYEKKTRQNEQSHWTIRFLVERFKRIKKFLLE